MPEKLGNPSGSLSNPKKVVFDAPGPTISGLSRISKVVAPEVSKRIRVGPAEEKGFQYCRADSEFRSLVVGRRSHRLGPHGVGVSEQRSAGGRELVHASPEFEHHVLYEPGSRASQSDVLHDHQVKLRLG